MKIKGAIFDMDGTLVDSLMFWDYLWRQIGINYMSDETFKPSEEVDKNVRTMIYSDAMKYVREYYSIPCSESEFLKFSTDGLENFYRYEVKVKAGAHELLSYLKSQNIKLCLASASITEHIKIALDACALSEYFECVFSCADIGVGKDRPDIYLKAKDALALDIGDICVVEDSFVAIETAKGAGFLTVGVFDKYSFDQNRLRASSDIYIGEKSSLEILINSLE